MAAAVPLARSRWVATKASLEALTCLTAAQKSLVKPVLRYAIVEDAVWSAEPLSLSIRIFLAVVAVGVLTVIPAVVSFTWPPSAGLTMIVFLATYVATAGVLITLPNAWLERFLPRLAWASIGLLYAVLGVAWLIRDLPRWLELAVTGVLTAGSLLSAFYVMVWFVRQIRSRLSLLMPSAGAGTRLTTWRG